MNSAKDLIQSILDYSDGKSLAQSGVKGMKWGILRSRSAKAAHKVPASIDAATAARYKEQARKQGLHTLDNDQLKDLTKRLELEKKWNDYAKANPTRKQRAVSFIANEVKKEATAVAFNQLGIQTEKPVKGSPIMTLLRSVDTQRKVAKGTVPKHRK